MKKKPSLSELLGTVPVRVGDWNDFLNLFKTKENAVQAGEGKELYTWKCDCGKSFQAPSDIDMVWCKECAKLGRNN